MKNINKFIRENLRRFLKESVEASSLVDFTSFPESILDTLDNEYGDYNMNFDWNDKQDELGSNFQNWYRRNKSIQFINNLDSLIRKTSEDVELIKKRQISQMKLQAFEELIIPSLGEDVLGPALTKYEEWVLMNPNATKEDIERGFAEAKNILDKDGNIEFSKVTKSTLFPGGELNIPAFELFVKQKPEYRGVYNDWKQLFDEDIKLSLQDLHAFRSSTGLSRIVELRDFLIQYKSKLVN